MSVYPQNTLIEHTLCKTLVLLKYSNRTISICIMLKLELLSSNDVYILTFCIDCYIMIELVIGIVLTFRNIQFYV